jgi:hypothetical protein
MLDSILFELKMHHLAALLQMNTVSKQFPSKPEMSYTVTILKIARDYLQQSVH